jgi:hypothetical protein
MWLVGLLDKYTPYMVQTHTLTVCVTWLHVFTRLLHQWIKKVSFPVERCCKSRDDFCWENNSQDGTCEIVHFFWRKENVWFIFQLGVNFLIKCRSVVNIALEGISKYKDSWNLSTIQLRCDWVETWKFIGLRRGHNFWHSYISYSPWSEKYM